MKDNLMSPQEVIQALDRDANSNPPFSGSFLLLTPPSERKKPIFGKEPPPPDAQTSSGYNDIDPTVDEVSFDAVPRDEVE